MKIDITEIRKITVQILIDITRVWMYRKYLKALFLHEEMGVSLDALSKEFNVSIDTVKKYIAKVNQIEKSGSKEEKYKMIIAMLIPEKNKYDNRDIEEIRRYVIGNNLHAEEWFYKN
ncbi:TPA: HTH domain-containing protein [Yersinia enterocolitica]|uniref:HTH domain-containing protein n=1 Tax=Yersinia enterocolitica TaxID=630 RepID=A0A7T9XTH0_YEREN|nr:MULTISPECIES: HTH domain-containing protein [Enterobacterales]HDC0124627.1 HTH domain-containing protein [Escherichia coli]EHB19334.1 hypothetical protein IOK_18807 [Yersinia enterocolitica subsp. palearctica PhRBD_Ye1]EKN3314890.1 HTH domain-containing protein [Yersinia enterocolitica]EKN3318792.1 HTH domain-containing protein [Yersinia enterocolitica]EKN3322742.1 HTH domain-containing protein [Yersinia enterocolitica]